MAKVNTTMVEDMFNPEVCADMLNEHYDALLKMLPYAKVDKTLVGRPGDTLTIPKWDYIGEAVDTGEGEDIPITEMSHTSTQFTIKKISKGVVLTTEAIERGDGDPKGTAIRQLAKALKDKTDSDIHDAVLDATLRYDGSSSKISYEGIINALAMFQDEEEGNASTMFIHPVQFAALQLDPNFTSRDKFDKSIIPHGTLGQIASAWVKQSRKVRHNDVKQGSRTITIGGTIKAGDKFHLVFNANPVNQVKVDYVAVEGDDATKVATALVGLINAKVEALVTASNNAGVITLKEAVGEFGIALRSAPACKATGAATAVLGGTYEGEATFNNAILKNEIDSTETGYSDAELPAIKILLKKDAKVVPAYNNGNDTWEITATKHGGVALTNASKVVLATFKG